jgi:hypothetical protein
MTVDFNETPARNQGARVDAKNDFALDPPGAAF